MGGIWLRRKLSWLLVAVLLVVVAAEFLIPLALEHRVKVLLENRLLQAENLDVRIQSRPAAASFLGRFRRIFIHAQNFSTADLLVDEFTVAGEHVRLDPRKLYNGGEVSVQRARDLRVSVALSEAGINQYMWDKIDPERRLEVIINPDGAVLKGNINFFGHGIDVYLKGGFEIRNQSQLIFVPETLTMEQLEVPSVILNALVEDRALLVDLAALPVPLALDEVRLEEGRLSAFGHYAEFAEEGR